MSDNSENQRQFVAEEALRESDTRYKSLYSMMRLMCDNVPDLIWAKDLDGKYIFVNRAMCEKLLNASDIDEPIGKTDQFFGEREQRSHPEDPHWHDFGRICANSDSIVKESRQAGRFEECGNVKGRFLCLDVHKAPFWDSRGEMIGTVGCARDVTQEKLLEVERSLMAENLRESEAKYRTLFDNANDAIFVLQDDRFIECNLKTLEMFARDKDEIIGRAPYELSPEFQSDGRTSKERRYYT